MKRTPLKRRKPTIPGVIARRKKAGIPDDAPTNQWGQSCAEKKCAVCGEKFLAPWSLRLARNTCSRKCGGIQSAARRSRKGEANPNYRNGSKVGVRDRAGERRWYAALGHRCEHPACPGDCGRLCLHHVVYRQHVEGAAGDVWDTRNAMTIGAGCHLSHHVRGRRVIPASALPTSAYDFARDLLGPGGAYEYIRRRYQGDDPRLAELAAEWENATVERPI